MVNLPAAAAGQSVVFRWRAASDTTVSATGWWVDSIALEDGFTCCTPIAEGLDVDAPNALAAPAASQNDVWEPGETVVVEPSYFNGDSVAAGADGDAART